MDEQISEKTKKNDAENKTLIRVGILLCVSLIVVVGWGIYASKNIRPAESRITQTESKATQTRIYKTEIQSEVEQVNTTQLADVSEILRVSKVVDGDTVVVENIPENKLSKNASQRFTVRLIGINTPETVDPRKKVECFGKEASAKAKEMLLGKMVRLEYDDTQDTIDKYGRRLAYVFIQDTTAEIFFNRYMIEQGYAYEYTYSKAYKYQAEFKSAQKTAEAGGRGLWAPQTCGGRKSV